MRKIERILISAADRERLDRLIRDRNTPQKVVWRARIVRLAGDGLSATAIAAAVGKSVLTVRRWRRRYEAKGVDGLLKDATRPPRRKPLSAETINRVVHMTLHETPPNATHWSLRRMAAAAGLSHSSVQRIWQAHGLKPHRVETFKVSRDKNFAAKVAAVLRRDHPQPHPPRRLHKRRRPQERDHGLPRPPQRRSQTLHLDQVRRRNRSKKSPARNKRWNHNTRRASSSATLEVRRADRWRVISASSADQVDRGRRCWREVQLEARMWRAKPAPPWSVGCSCRRSHARRGAW